VASTLSRWRAGTEPSAKIYPRHLTAANTVVNKRGVISARRDRTSGCSKTIGGYLRIDQRRSAHFFRIWWKVLEVARGLAQIPLEFNTNFPSACGDISPANTCPGGYHEKAGSQVGNFLGLANADHDTP
jgi:hypothetical protein